MASFFRAPAARPGWTVEECARFAALKEYELLKLLGADPKTLRVARRLGFAERRAAPPPKEAREATKGGGSTGESRSKTPAKTREKRHRRSQRDRKLRLAAAVKLQALGRGFLARCKVKKLPAAQKLSSHRSLWEAQERAVALRESSMAVEAAAPTRKEDQRATSPKRPAASLAGKAGASRRISRPSSPLASPATSYTSACEGEWQVSFMPDMDDVLPDDGSARP